MHPLRRSRSLRAVLGVAALALLLVGGNLCMVAGLAASHGRVVPMGAMTLTLVAPAHAGSAAAGHCCKGGTGRPARAPQRGVAPCCMSLVPVSAPAPADPVPADAPALVAAAVAVATPAVHVVARGPHPDPFAPPESPPLVSRAPRAPPTR